MKKIVYGIFILCLSFATSLKAQQITVTSPKHWKPCTEYMLEFDVEAFDAIAKVEVYDSPEGFGDILRHSYVLNGGDQGKDSMHFAYPLQVTSGMYWYKIIVKTKNGFVAQQKNYIDLDQAPVLARNPNYANTIKFTNYLYACQPIDSGGIVVPCFLGSCGQIISSFDTAYVNNAGELIVTVWGDDPATSETDGFVHGGRVWLYERSEGVFKELHNQTKFDSTKAITDTIIVDNESASGVNYNARLIPFGRDVNLGAINHPFAKEYTLSNLLCNKSLQPRITSIDVGDSYEAVQTSDTSFVLNYDGAGYPEMSMLVYYDDYFGPSTNQRYKYVHFTGRVGDYLIELKINDERGKPLIFRSDSLHGLPAVDTSNKWVNDDGFLTGAPRGWSGNIFVDYMDYTFVPNNIAISNLQKDTLIEITALYNGKRKLKLATYKGAVSIDPFNGNKVTSPPAVNCQYWINGTIVQGDSVGGYTDSLPARWSGKIVPIFPDYQFDTLSITSLLSDMAHNFSSTYIGNYTISGICTDYNDRRIAGVMVTCDADTAYTNSSGWYSLSLPAGWSGEIKAEKTDHFWSGKYGETIRVKELRDNLLSQDFYGGEKGLLIRCPELRNMLLNNPSINKNGDDYIQYSEARAYRGGLKLPPCTQSGDAAELAYFENITEIDIRNTLWLDSFDFTPFTKLLSVRVENTSFIHIDLSQAPYVNDVISYDNDKLLMVCIDDTAKLTTPGAFFIKDEHTKWSQTCNLPIVNDIVDIACGSYTLGSQVITKDGVYYEKFKTPLGLDSVVIASIYFPTRYSYFYDTIEKYETYKWGTKTLFQGGHYYHEDTLKRADGCADSIRVLNLIQPGTKYFNWYITTGRDSVEFDGNYLHQSGTYYDTTRLANGMDSIYVLHLSFLTSDSLVYFNETRTLCGDYPFAGQTLTQSGIYYDTIQLNASKKQITVMDYTRLSVPDVIIDTVIDFGETFRYNGMAYSSSGTYVQDLYTVCLNEHPTATINVTVLDNDYIVAEITDTACGQYNFRGHIIDQSGTYYDTTVVADGRDSITVLYLTIGETYALDINDTIPAGGYYLFDSDTVTQAGIYTQEYYSVTGCDSIVSLHLAVNPTPIRYVYDTVESCQSATLYNKTYSETGVYYDTITKSDYGVVVAILDYTHLFTPSEVLDTVIDYGETLTCNGKIYTKTGTYVEPINSVCPEDTPTFTINLTVRDKEIAVNKIVKEVCSQYDNWKGTTLWESGVYYDTLAVNAHKDSITILDLTILHQDHLFVRDTILNGTEKHWEGNAYNATGNYTVTYTNRYGCDSIRELELAVLDKEIIRKHIEKTACGRYYFDGKWIVTSGIYTQIISVSEFRDSIVVLDLTVNKEYNTFARDTIVQGEIRIHGTQTLTVPGEYKETFQTIYGCDSVVTLALVVKEKAHEKTTIQERLDETACEAYEFAGKKLTQTGVYYDTISVDENTNKVTILSLQINQPYQEFESKSIYMGERYQFGSQILSVAGKYQEIFAAQNGCDSIVSLDLDVQERNVVEHIVNMQVCEQYEFGGATLTESGTYYDTVTVDNATDSVVVLQLKISKPVYIEINEAREFGTYYQFGAKKLTVAGVYEETFVSATGCDSTVRLDLEVFPKFEEVAYEFSVKPTVANGDEIGTVNALIAEGSQIWYTLHETNGIFEIESETGVITISDASQLLNSEREIYEFAISAVSNRSVAEVTVTVRVANKSVAKMPVAQSIEIYPTVVKNKLHIDGTNGLAVVSVKTITGKLVYRQTIESSAVILFNHLPAGVYMIDAQDSSAKKLVRVIKY